MKNLFYILLLSPLFFISSCDEDVVHGCLDSQAINYNSQASIDNNSCEYPEIGSLFQGGIVFYVDVAGEYGFTGLVAALEDLTEGATDPFGSGFSGYEWGCFMVYVDGADGQTIGAGYQNTMDIVSQGCSTEYGGITAAQAALGAEINGYSDWYLPSIDELEEMYVAIGKGSEDGNIGGFENTWYWSSSEYDSNDPVSNYAWIVGFDGGFTTGGGKKNASKVRVIRDF